MLPLNPHSELYIHRAILCPSKSISLEERTEEKLVDLTSDSITSFTDQSLSRWSSAIATSPT